jgi:hypothetical protein
MTANRRKEIFKAVRGSKLSGVRGRGGSEPVISHAVAAKKNAAYEDEPLTRRRVRLEPPIEDETTGLEFHHPNRYSEPND